MVVVDTITATNGGLAGSSKELMENAAIGTGRPCEGDAGRNVLVVPVPIGLLPVGLSGKVELHDGSIGLAGEHSLAALIEPVMQADRRRNLGTGCLVRRLQQGVARAESQGKVGGHAPGILAIQLKLVGPEMTRHKGAFRQHAKSLSEVVV